MKALSIRQPWAWLIVNGIKDIENRTWGTAFRGRVLVHASKTYPKQDYRDDVEMYDTIRRPFPPREEMIGGIVGMVSIVDCVTASDSQWFNGPYGFVLRWAYSWPLIPFPGQLGFFDVPDDVVSEFLPNWGAVR
jgi:hypothetical protein